MYVSKRGRGYKLSAYPQGTAQHYGFIKMTFKI